MSSLEALLPAFGLGSTVPILVRPDIAWRTHAVRWVRIDGRLMLLCHSLESLRQLMRGVTWHDEPDHCRTWSEGCRCDLGEGA